MGNNFANNFVSTESLATPLLVMAAVVMIAVWLAIHRFVPVSRRTMQIVRFVVAVGVGSVALLLAFRSLERFITLGASGELPWIVFGGALAIESVVALYRFERQAVPEKIRRWTGVCRVLAVVSVLLMLLEPTFSKKTIYIDEREVVVLVDDSLSMDQSDAQSTASEKLSLAELLLPGRVENRFQGETICKALGDTQQALGTEIAWLEQAAEQSSEGDEGKQTERLDGFHTAIRDAKSIVDTQRDSLGEALTARQLPADAAEAVQIAATALKENVSDVLARVQETTEGSDLAKLAEQSASLTEQLNDAASALAEVSEQVKVLQSSFDQADYDALAEGVRQEVDATAARSRREIAAAALEGIDSDHTGLLKALQEKYSVRFYKFAGEPVETTADEWKNATGEPQERGATDLATALVKVKSDVTASKLSGVVVLSDGQHNTKHSVDAAARQPELRGAGVHSVMIGSTARVTDAALLNVHSPARVQPNDRFVLSADLKFDGFRGRAAKVELMHDEKVVDEKTIDVPNDVFRTSVELGDTPTEAGLKAYELRLSPLEGERISDNNTRAVHVRVVDDPTRLLIVEDRPRWEFRYLRRLFAERDKSVRLQHLLLQPDWIEGAPTREVVPASASRGPGESEASAFPATEDAWMRFDAIILGDVSPDQLGTEVAATLKKFVSERGGRLIMIAGQNHMPHGYSESPLAEMIPVTVTPSNSALAPSKEPSFLARLTSDGEQHGITRLNDDREENRLLWNSLPELRLRYPVTGTKPGATVLAFAMPLEEPNIFRQSSDIPEEIERLADERKQFVSEHALITVLPYGAGQVLMLNFDGTWRMRYRHGDAHHHRFWGQVMNWATTDKLADGNDLVRLGTTPDVYEPLQTVKIRARLSDKASIPFITDKAAISVKQGDTLVVQKQLTAVPDTPGMYEAEIGPLTTIGRYRVTLAVDDETNTEVAEAAKEVATEFVVAAKPSLETSELAGDRSTLDLLASETGGIVVAPQNATTLLAHLGPTSRPLVEEDLYPLWHSWPLLAIITCLLTSEWILRKKAGLP